MSDINQPKCECHNCENDATIKLKLFGDNFINMCDKCYDNVVKSLQPISTMELKVMINLPKELEELNPKCFAFENYESTWWNLFDMNFEQSLELGNLQEAIETYAIGYCESSKVILRPNPTDIAIMFEKDGMRFWFHVEKWCLEDYRKGK